MAKAHAILSPSGAERWLNCTPSARLEQQFPDSAGEYAKEGTLAHSLGELLLRLKLDSISKQKFDVELRKIQKNELYSEEMLGHADDYSVFVMERFYEAQNHTKDALIFLEQRLDLREYIPEGFGTGDAVIVADEVLDIIDMKYGKGVLVSAENNKQMMLYGLGALREMDFLYDIKTVRMTIYQPRLENFSSFEMKVTDLMAWAENELKPRVKMAFDGDGNFIVGKHCTFCKAKATCRAFAEYNLELAKYDFEKPELLTDEEISDILDRKAAFLSWIGAVDEFALEQAVKNGKKWPGYKLVEGRSNRKYADEEQIAFLLQKEGYGEELIFKPKKLVGLTEMQANLGKVKFEQLLKGFIIKPPGKPTLAPLSDKRPEYNSTEAAKNDFAHVEVN